MSGTSFVQRKLDFTFELGTGQFGDGKSNTVKLSGHRATANIVKAGYASMGGAEVAIFGMPLSGMNKLSTLGIIPAELRRNTLTIEAGDVGGAMTQVFRATITQAWFDGEGAPDTPFRVTCFAGAIEAVQKVEASSFPGRVDAAVVMKTIADKMNLQFENNDVSVMLSTPYYPGTGRQQALACATAANINWLIDGGVLAIWPINGARVKPVATVSAATGMVGYPSFHSLGISVRTLFNPGIIYGSNIRVESTLPVANKVWTVNTLTYELSEQTPGGPWFQTVECSPAAGS